MQKGYAASAWEELSSEDDSSEEDSSDEDSSDEKRLLYSCTAAVVQKVYLEKWLEAVAAEEAQ